MAMAAGISSKKLTRIKTFCTKCYTFKIVAQRYFIYRSKLFEQFATAPSLQNIVDEARSRNATAGITGFMHVQDLEVLQYLEGDSERLHEIQESIFRDPRHGQIVLIAEGEIISARFPNWAMGMASPGAVAPLHFPPLLDWTVKIT